MLESTSCTGNVIVIEDVKYDPVPYTGTRCHDCGCPIGGTHHPNCDMERCPKCEGQLISCGCLDEEEDDE